MKKYKMENKRIAIIGGGINGLFLAWKLAQKGNDVTVFEKKLGIGSKIVCSGLFSQRILEYIPQSRALIKNRIKSAVLHFPKKTITINFSKDFFVIDHSSLDKLVADLALKEGARITLDQSINTIPSGFDRVIGCDGVNSSARKFLGLPDPCFRLGLQVFSRKESLADFVETWPTKKGFIWKIPQGDKVEYGIIDDPGSARKTLEDFLGKNNIKTDGLEAKLIPQGLIIPVNEKMTLCGDAAGLTKPWSGGGVVWGLRAAEILVESYPDFLAYRRKVRRFFLPKIFMSKLTTKIGYFIGFKLPWLLPGRIKIESDFIF